VKIAIENLTKRYGAVVAVDNLSLTIADGELLVLLGPSGCGKTTTMRAIVGLEEPTSGRISVGDSVAYDAARGINVPPNKRQMGMVFQSYAIWPHRTVGENVAYPLERQGLSKAEIAERLARTLALVGLSDFAGRGASLLSGGQMQRVALARSIIAQPRVLLLDEPLSNLDAKLRDHLRFELREIQQRLGITAVYVTHDQTEALALADRIAVMRDGRIIQLDTPSAIYRKPANTFVADFLGVGNIFPGGVMAVSPEGISEVKLAAGNTVLRSAMALAIGVRTNVCVRPEHLMLSDGPPLGIDPRRVSTLPVTVEVATFLGNQIRYLVSGDGMKLNIVANDTSEIFPRGARLHASIRAEHVQLLPD
jgi:iron(III) transport system ATP-binding protein